MTWSKNYKSNPSQTLLRRVATHLRRVLHQVGFSMSRFSTQRVLCYKICFESGFIVRVLADSSNFQFALYKMMPFCGCQNFRHFYVKRNDKLAKVIQSCDGYARKTSLCSESSGNIRRLQCFGSRLWFIYRKFGAVRRPSAILMFTVVCVVRAYGREVWRARESSSCLQLCARFINDTARPPFQHRGKNEL